MGCKRKPLAVRTSRRSLGKIEPPPGCEFRCGSRLSCACDREFRRVQKKSLRIGVQRGSTRPDALRQKHQRRSQHLTIDSRVASEQLDRILTFFARVDSRASMLFAANSAILGVLAARVDVKHLEDWQISVPAALSLIAIVYSFGSLYLCAYPNTRGGNGSNVFFGSIARKTESAFVDEFRRLSEEEWLRDLAAQIWRNSEILCLKYKFLKNAMISTTLGLIPWAVFISLTRFG